MERLFKVTGILKNKADYIKNATASMRIRLFVFLSVLVITMLFAIIIILLLTGAFTAGLNETEDFMVNELSNIKRNVEKQYGDISARTINLSKELSRSIENKLIAHGLYPSDLKNHPDVLEGILTEEFERLLLYLEKTKSSGVFVILDATINNSLKGSDHSRAGLYIKNMEPNILNSAEPTITVLRGIASIGRSKGFRLHSQWSMEFDIQNAPYYTQHFTETKKAQLPLSRLYYWSHAFTFPETSEDVMLCSIPLIDSNGDVFGVCGFEVSAMLFKLNFMPHNSVYKRIFCMLSPMNESNLNVSGALFSGSYAAFNNNISREYLTFIGSNRNLYKYEQSNKRGFVGLHKTIKLYPDDSSFSGQNFALALIMPQEDLNDFLTPIKLRLILLCFMFLCLGIGLSFYISKRYIKPITDGLNVLRTDNINIYTKTNIQEIDEIIEQIREKHGKESPLPDNLFEDFISRVKTLTPTEKAIFKHYLDGRTNNEILSLMYISLSTFKTHNSHIYSKLGISSKNELLLYVKLIQKSGLISDII